MVGKQSKGSETMRVGSCKCKGKKCDGGFGWKWHTADLGNRIAGHKAGRTWAEPCPEWDGTLDVWFASCPARNNEHATLSDTKWKDNVDNYVGGDE